jgi:hypothetical protein
MKQITKVHNCKLSRDDLLRHILRVLLERPNFYVLDGHATASRVCGVDQTEVSLHLLV